MRYKLNRGCTHATILSETTQFWFNEAITARESKKNEFGFMWMHHKRNYIYCRNDNKNLRTLKPSFYLFNHNSILPRPFSIGWMHFGHASLTKYNRFIFQMIFHIILMIEREKNPKERIDVNESTESLSRFMRVCVYVCVYVQWIEGKLR